MLVRGVGYFESGAALLDSFSPSLKSKIDQSVYKPVGKRQLFRLPYCSKNGDDRPLQYVYKNDNSEWDCCEELSELNIDFVDLLIQNVEGEQLIKAIDQLDNIPKSIVSEQMLMDLTKTDDDIPKSLTDSEYINRLQVVLISIHSIWHYQHLIDNIKRMISPYVV